MPQVASAPPTGLVYSLIVGLVSVRTLRYAISFLDADLRVARLTFERACLLGALTSFRNHDLDLLLLLTAVPTFEVTRAASAARVPPTPVV